MSARQLPRSQFPRAVLFDLDGTLLDSAPDMLATVNQMRVTRTGTALSLEQLRPVVSKGARAMLAVAFPDLPVPERDALLPEFLHRYEQLIGEHSRLFDGVDALLQTLESAGVCWGIVTNKPEYLAKRIVLQLGWQQRCVVLIGGDSLPERKPHPLPLLIAAERIGVAASDCVYVGDDERDIIAASAAAMPAVAALWGYRLQSDYPAAWGADALAASASELIWPEAWPRAFCRTESRNRE